MCFLAKKYKKSKTNKQKSNMLFCLLICFKAHTFLYKFLFVGENYANEFIKN